MAPDEDGQAGARAAAPLLRDLQHDAIEHHGVVAGDDPRLFVTEDGLELGGRHPGEAHGGIRRPAAEGPVELGQKPLDLPWMT